MQCHAEQLADALADPKHHAHVEPYGYQHAHADENAIEQSDTFSHSDRNADRLSHAKPHPDCIPLSLLSVRLDAADWFFLLHARLHLHKSLECRPQLLQLCVGLEPRHPGIGALSGGGLVCVL